MTRMLALATLLALAGCAHEYRGPAGSTDEQGARIVASCRNAARSSVLGYGDVLDDCMRGYGWVRTR